MIALFITRNTLFIAPFINAPVFEKIFFIAVASPVNPFLILEIPVLKLLTTNEITLDPVFLIFEKTEPIDSFIPENFSFNQVILLPILVFKFISNIEV